MDEKIEELKKEIKEIQPFFYASLAEHIIEKGYRKESDTAKEILQIIKEEYGYIGDLEKIIKERYGVEVE